MSKDQFLAGLRVHLGSMPDAEKDAILSDFVEHFRIGVLEGRSEESIAEALGDPKLLGRSYVIDAMLDAPKGGGAVSVGSIVRAVFASVGLTLGNLVAVLGPFLAFVAVLIVLWAAAASIAISGAALVLVVVAWPATVLWLPLEGLNPAFLFFSGVGFAALGLLAAFGMWKLTRELFRLVVKYVKLNTRIVMRKKGPKPRIGV